MVYWLGYSNTEVWIIGGTIYDWDAGMFSFFCYVSELASLGVEKIYQDTWMFDYNNRTWYWMDGPQTYSIKTIYVCILIT